MKVLVVGDVIADVYRECIFKKMCPDAPEVKAIVEHSTDIRPGGAANVAVNLSALAPDARIHLIGDMSVELARVIKCLSHNRVNLEHCYFSGDPITKERILLDGELLLRKDNKLTVSKFDAESLERDLRDYFAENDPDLIVLSDYGAGSINDASWEMLLKSRDRLLVDTKLTDLSRFGSGEQRTKLVKLNWDEHNTVMMNEYAPERFFQTLFVTCGSRGVYLKVRENISQSKSITHTLRVDAHAVDAVDVCGCGDTFMAGLAASLLKNDDPFTAMQFANAAAATVVTKARTSVADLGETLRLLGVEEGK